VRIDEDFLQLLLEFCNGLRWLRRVLFFVLGKASRCEQAEKHEPGYGFHAAHSPLERPKSASG